MYELECLEAFLMLHMDLPLLLVVTEVFGTLFRFEIPRNLTSEKKRCLKLKFIRHVHWVPWWAQQCTSYNLNFPV